VLVLLGGLVVAQLISFAIHMHERGELLSQASGMQSAQRIADIVRLLETLGPEERRRIVQVLSAPPLTISLDRPALVAGEGGPEKGARGALFGAMLRRFLGDGYPVVVALAEGAPVVPGAMRGFKGSEMHRAWMPPMAAGQFSGQAGFSFLAQVRLQDGSLVTFDSRLAQETASWPYRLLLSLAVLLAAVVAVSLVAVRWATRPLNALADAAGQLGKDINRPPLPEKGPQEVRRAAQAFNTMQARLIGYIRERTALLAAMSHDLKTPITRLRLRSELLGDPQLKEKFTKDLDEMESMVGATLDFLRGLENREAIKPVDIMALLESLQADLAELGGRIEIRGAALRPYPGKPQALKRCLANVLENAVKYGIARTPAGGDVTIRARRDGATVRLEVENTGALAAANGDASGLDNARQRLQRVARARQAFGDDRVPEEQLHQQRHVADDFDVGGGELLQQPIGRQAREPD